MDNHKVNIKYKPIKSNLVNLPSHLSNLLFTANINIQDVIVEIITKSKQAKYVGWSGMSSTSPQTLEIDPVFAQAINLSDNDSVVLNLKLDNYETANINLEPVTSSDWELVELHAQNIEDKLLSQTRCVSIGQILVVYPSSTTVAKLNVVDIGDGARTYGKISPYCEIAIAPKVRDTSVKSTKSGKSSRSTAARVEEDYSEFTSVLRRGISLPHKLYNVKNQGYQVYANFQELPSELTAEPYIAVSVVSGPTTTPTKQAPNDFDIKENKRIVARLIDCQDSPKGNIALSSKLAHALNVSGQIGNIIVLKPAVKSLPKRPTVFTIHPYTLSTPAKQKDTKTQALMDAMYPELSSSAMTNFARIPSVPGVLPYGGILKFRRNEDVNAWIRPYSLDNKKPIRLELGEELLRPASFVELEEKKEVGEAIGLDAIVEDIVDSFTISPNTGTLVHGSNGSGKTLLLNLVAEKLTNQGHFVKYVSCNGLINENFQSISKSLFKYIQLCSWHKPSLLILDDLDKIIPVEMEQIDSSKSNQTTEFLISTLAKIHNQPNSNVSILVSSNSQESINKLLGGSHLIENYHHLNPPNKQLRFDLLHHYLSSKVQVGIDLMDVVGETEGYLPNDLKILADRIYHECLFSSAQTITQDHVTKAITGFTPSNLRGVNLEKSPINWNDIGGLTEAKKILTETLEWPTKYAPIFANCPLRLRSGILLYGYPGCGKTLLASAIANECGLNFISIKGPEILNKYIGASEQSVRELFERAQSAKPCILFFDEFDSIAPKRGHDSTGVTDRVVNQMLTQMDGAEGLDGVYVLAATSRPDLIDSALLRPGRLDKSVICDLPDYECRLDILQRVCNNMELADDVNLKEIAESTDGFSGADLQGLVYNGYLKAVHVVLEQEQEEVQPVDNQTIEFFKVDAKVKPHERVSLLHQIQQFTTTNEKTVKATGKNKVVITHENFVDSLKETKPSISISEKNKLSNIYNQFVSGRDGNMPDGQPSNEIGGRVTLM
ncbi:uncharacterized protein SPAPADRAFT_144695 [Spathaspora passalidarum NRRL Y-27907]|uniref:Peroxisomal ATPase PEX1 n=1 Tax=Spathaspora passalidarum (strain NRRL Y-27907 / 11-Y1) TaxID=619300 RepID=G3AV31_SPAPN|nr:uncharacterized protein SPAPADRAFT_144695 [Spathaspora passalidarum NRRL Y-27907]EGW30105.1 hypothetical protein SPAPADRAFT_144695 [Spathaspora passalidarum NRRL Y-27907]